MLHSGFVALQQVLGAGFPQQCGLVLGVSISGCGKRNQGGRARGEHGEHEDRFVRFLVPHYPGAGDPDKEAVNPFYGVVD